jgi:hypothetical protein
VFGERIVARFDHFRQRVVEATSDCAPKVSTLLAQLAGQS